MCWWCLCSMPVSWVVAFPATCGLHLLPVVLGTYPEMHLMECTVIPHHHPFTAVVPFYISPEITHFSCFGVVVTVIKWYTIVVLVCTSLMTSDDTELCFTRHFCLGRCEWPSTLPNATAGFLLCAGHLYTFLASISYQTFDFHILGCRWTLLLTSSGKVKFCGSSGFFFFFLMARLLLVSKKSDICNMI